MCKGREEEIRNQIDLNQKPLDDDDEVSGDRNMNTIFCELCSSKASLYCEADDAFLCRKCDKNVHGANFLAFRHVRCLLCSSCQNLTVLYLSGSSFKMVLGAGRRSNYHHDSKADEECSRFAKKKTTLSI